MYFLAYHLTRGLPCLYHSGEEPTLIYLFDQTGTFTTSPHGHTVAFPHRLFFFIDMDVKEEAPPSEFVLSTSTFPIQASSPCPARYKIWTKKTQAIKWYSETWEERELREWYDPFVNHISFADRLNQYRYANSSFIADGDDGRLAGYD
jgi:hypothetical protein